MSERILLLTPQWQRENRSLLNSCLECHNFTINHLFGFEIEGVSSSQGRQTPRRRRSCQSKNRKRKVDSEIPVSTCEKLDDHSKFDPRLVVTQQPTSRFRPLMAQSNRLTKGSKRAKGFRLARLTFGDTPPYEKERIHVDDRPPKRE